MAATKNNGPANIGSTASIAIVVFPHFSRYIVNPDEIGKDIKYIFYRLQHKPTNNIFIII